MKRKARASAPRAARRKAQPSHSPPRPPRELYQLVVDCRDEAQQQELFERLAREGLRCRVLTM